MAGVVSVEATRISLFIARLLGPLITIAGVALLAHPDIHRATLTKFIRSGLALSYFGCVNG